jgi:hypothetical protein
MEGFNIYVMLCIYIYIYICLNIYVMLCIYIYMRKHICYVMFINIYIYIYIYTHNPYLVVKKQSFRLNLHVSPKSDEQPINRPL